MVILCRFLLACFLCLIFIPIKANLTIAQQIVPRFERDRCYLDELRREIKCGWLIVPEDRGNPGSPSLRLFVMIFTTPRSDKTDPVLYLTGGPGIHFSKQNYLDRASDVASLLGGRDLIFVAQRGTGRYQPSLECHNMDALPERLLTQPTSFQQAEIFYTQSALACRDSLLDEGINLAAYTSAESAADLRDLRQLLGIERWNVYGLSYGTRLALTLLRDDPEGIRSVMLDSVYMPPQTDFLAELIPNAAQTFQALFEACYQDSACRATYPDLEAVFLETVDQLNADPGVIGDYQIDGAAFVGLIYRMLYRSADIPTLPDLIYRVHEGRVNDLLTPLQIALLEPGSYSGGLNRSIYCADEAQFTTRETVEQAAEGVDRRYWGHYHWDVDPFALPELCREWNDQPPNPMENEPVVSDIPTLILMGEFDPASPPVHGQRVSESLSHSYFYTYPGMGHHLLLNSPCAYDMIAAFLDNPDTPPDDRCMDEMQLEFEIPNND